MREDEPKTAFDYTERLGVKPPGPPIIEDAPQQVRPIERAPARRWHGLAKEVGVVVLGVFIALVGEQAVENYREKEAAASASNAINSELQWAAVNAGLRIALDDCLRGRIAHLNTKLAKDEYRWIADPMSFGKHMPGMPVMPMAYSVPEPGLLSSAWEMTVANGLVRHMPSTRAEEYSGRYLMIAASATNQRRERGLAAYLQRLARTRILNARSAYEAATNLAELDDLNSSVVFNSASILIGIKELGINLAPAKVALRRSIDLQRGLRGQCVKPAVLD